MIYEQLGTLEKEILIATETGTTYFLQEFPELENLIRSPRFLKQLSCAIGIAQMARTSRYSLEDMTKHKEAFDSLLTYYYEMDN